MIRATHLRAVAAAALLVLAATAGDALAGPAASSSSPIVIGHRGASGYLPEHTLAAYALAVSLGADFIEPDLVSTKDGHLIARHENLLDQTTDVADHPEFADLRTAKRIDGALPITGWWSEDFTLAEIKQLRAKERIPTTRPGNARLDRQLEIPTLQEVIDLAKGLEKATGRKIGIYPETKHPTYFDGIGLSMEEPLVRILRENGYEGKRDRVFIQSFEISNLRNLRRMTNIPLVQLFGGGQPYDVVAAGGTLTYAQMATAEGLAEIATYADGVGPEKSYIIPRTPVTNELDPRNVTPFVRDAHAVGLKVHPYTFRVENTFLPVNLRSSADPARLNDRGDLAGEIRAYLEAGIDGFFTDNTDVGVKARDAFVAAD